MRILKKLFSYLTSRMFVIAVLLLAQLAIYVTLIFYLNNYVFYMQILSWILSVLLLLYVVGKPGSPSAKIPWIMIFCVLPVLGVPLYLLCGSSDVHIRYKRSLKRSLAQTEKMHVQDERVAKQLENENLLRYRESDYIFKVTKMPIHRNTKVQYFPSAELAWEEMVNRLKEAKHFIFMEFFIVEEGKMWNTILDVLKQKVQEGVEVRFMYDDIGCLQTLPSGYDKILQSYGIDCVVFNTFSPILTVGHNYRDHRKVCIIDGYIGFTGGYNLADEYINYKTRFGHWKDSGILLEGEGVWNQTISFLENWDFTKKVKSDFSKYSPFIYHPEPFINDGYVQPYADTPLDNELVGENVYMNVINHASKYLYITTPYFIVDNEMVQALCLAAKNGVDVRIVTPGIPDKWYVHLMTRAYYRQLLSAGVRIFEYSLGFIHAKNCLSDDEVAICGTINFDYRSLYHHFECACWMYQGEVISQMKDDFINTVDVSREITLDWCKKRPLFVRFAQSVVRIFSPLM